MKRRFRDSNLFKKNVKRLKGQQLQNLLNKIDEILVCEDLDHYKNLTKDLKKYKRVHVNTSYVILFFGDDGIVYFVDYEHHDVVYRRGKKHLRKYKDLKF